MFHPQRWDVPYQTHHACCEKLWFVRSIYPNLPQMGQYLYHGMLMPLHDSMPSFINALKTHLMHKNVQTNPEKSQKFTQQSSCSLLTREKIRKQ